MEFLYGLGNFMAPSLGRQDNLTRSTNVSLYVEILPGIIEGVTRHSYGAMSVMNCINRSTQDVELISTF